jgi:serine/threonine protein kinase
LKIAGEILEGIRYMHEMGYGHFDLKPANIFLTEDTSVKIGDFGFSAKFGYVVRGGSQEYIAPEQITGNNIGHTSFDIFALGTIYLEMLTRKKRDLKLEMKNENWIDVIWEKECLSYDIRLLPILKSLLHADPNERATVNDVITKFNEICTV